MRTTRRLLTAVLAATLAGCQSTDSATVTLETDQQKASYGIGLGMGGQLQAAADHIDMAALRAGLEDALAEREHRVSDEELQAAMQALNQTIQAEVNAMRLARVSPEPDPG